MEAVKMPDGCDFQWSEYERIDWSAVLDGVHSASSYCIRKGLSRKAQLAYFTKRYVAKHPQSILCGAMPQTIIIDTWPVWEDTTQATREGLADYVTSRSFGIAPNRRTRLEDCLLEARKAMDTVDNGAVWILKGSTVNKGIGIYLVHVSEELVDICWTDSDIREW